MGLHIKCGYLITLHADCPLTSTSQGQLDMARGGGAAAAARAGGVDTGMPVSGGGLDPAAVIKNLHGQV